MAKKKSIFKVFLIFVLTVAFLAIFLIFLFPKEDRKVEVITPSITVINQNIILDVGESLSINYEANISVLFSSSNTSVATVDHTGKVTALSPGISTITLTSIDKTVTKSVIVTVNEVLKVLSVKVQSDNKLTNSYVKKGDNLTIDIFFNQTIGENIKVFVHDKELSYTHSSTLNSIVVQKEIFNEENLQLKIYNDGNLIYLYDLPKVDNEIPKCTLEKDGEYLKISGTDNYGISGYAISKSGDYEYSLTTAIKFNQYGKWYGYVRDYVGNEASCWITLQEPSSEKPKTIDPANITIIGDSRMESLCQYDWYKKDNGVCIFKSGEGYNWLVSEAILKVRALSDNKKKYIVTNLGVNDLENIDKYIATYRELASGEWKNYMIFLESVNPTDGQWAHGNSYIDSFNAKLKDLASQYSNMSYCDTNTYLKKNGFRTSDGSHYLGSTSEVIYEQIKKCIYDYYN